MQAVLVLLCAFVALSASHMCIYEPEARGSPVATADWNTNFGASANAVCKQNVNVAPYTNGESASGGSTCGGTSDPTWNTVDSGATTTWTAGTTQTISILRNAAHVSPTNSRGSFFIIDYAIDSDNADEGTDFEPIAIIDASDGSPYQDSVNLFQFEYDWEIPASAESTGGVLRVVYVTGEAECFGQASCSGLVGPLPNNNVTQGNIAGYYSQCSDVIIEPAAVQPDSAARYTYF